MSEPRVVWGARQWLKKVERSSRDREYEETAAQKAARKAEKKRARAAPEQKDEKTGIVAQVQRFRCFVLHEGDLVPCKLRPNDPETEGLVVGDRVAFDPRSDGHGIIRSVQTRSTELVRMRSGRPRQSWREKDEVAHVLAANVDVAVIVASAAAPPFHPRLVDRYLVLCQYGEVQPLICLNKCDLAEEPPNLGIYERIGVPVVRTSAETGEGLAELRERLKGKLSVLTGHSGVGKSSLINRLLGEELLRVAEVNPYHGKGRHTTSSSSLHRWDEDSYIIDTPGIRSLSLWNVERRDVRLYFPEFEEASSRCRYRDCLHLVEPECGVKDAVERGAISPDRYDSYVRMMSE